MDYNTTKILDHMSAISKRASIAAGSISGFYRHYGEFAWDHDIKVTDCLRLVKRDGLGLNPVTRIEIVSTNPTGLAHQMDVVADPIIINSKLDIEYPLTTGDTPLIVMLREHTLTVEYTVDHRMPLTLMDWVDLLEKVIDQTFNVDKPDYYQETEDERYPVYKKRSQLCDVFVITHYDKGHAKAFAANADYLRASIIPSFAGANEPYPVFIEILDNRVFLHVVPTKQNLADLFTDDVVESKDD